MATPDDAKRPIIVIKKKGGHGGHHGGAWKVAYADFVTAMMALFIVLWLMNSSKQIQVAIGGYFKDPTGTSKKVGSNQTGSGENFTLTKDNMPKLKEELQKAVRQITNFDKLKNQIEMTVTSEGLRIELLESSSGTFFEAASPELNSDGEGCLSRWRSNWASFPTTSRSRATPTRSPTPRTGDYGNWELSTDRANSARRIMQANGLRADQISQVRGYADQKLRVPANPLEPSNRRISLIVQYVVKNDEDEPLLRAGAESSAKPSANSAKSEESRARTKPSEATNSSCRRVQH